MRKVVWLAEPLPLDYEVQVLLADPSLGWTTHVVCRGQRPAPRLASLSIDSTDFDDLSTLLARERPDLVVYHALGDVEPSLEAAQRARVPFVLWLPHAGSVQNLHAVEVVVAPSLETVERCQRQGVRRVLYCPPGYVPGWHGGATARSVFQADVLAWGDPPTNDSHEGTAIDRLARPVAAAQEIDLAVLGAAGWLARTPSGSYRGDFAWDDIPSLTASAPIVLDIASCAAHGRPGVTLPAALAEGTFCITERIPDWEQLFRNHESACWSNHEEETLEYVRHYLRDSDARTQVAEAGRRIASERLDYSKNVPRILEESRALAGGASRSFAIHRRVIDLARAGEYDEALLEAAGAIGVRPHPETAATWMATALSAMRTSRWQLAMELWQDADSCASEAVSAPMCIPSQPSPDFHLLRQATLEEMEAEAFQAKSGPARKALSAVLAQASSSGEALGSTASRVACRLMHDFAAEGNGCEALSAFRAWNVLQADVSPHAESARRSLARQLCLPPTCEVEDTPFAPEHPLTSWQALRLGSPLDEAEPARATGQRDGSRTGQEPPQTPQRASLLERLSNCLPVWLREPCLLPPFGVLWAVLPPFWLTLMVWVFVVTPWSWLRNGWKKLTGRKPAILWGPTPILNISSNSALDRRLGYPSETLVYTTYFITRAFHRDLSHLRSHPTWSRLFPHLAFIWAGLRFEIFQYYYDYGLWSWGGIVPQVRKLELPLLRLAGKRVIVSAYGSDIRVKRWTEALGTYHCCMECDQVGKACTFCDEKDAEANLAYVRRWASAMLSMMEMTEYTPGSRNDVPYWPIDVDAVPYVGVKADSRPVKVVHAPNHRMYKGTRHLIQAVENLRREGLPVELVLVERRPNEQARQIYREADIVADQFIIGSIGYVAVEAMAMGKPVICYIRKREYMPGGDECPIVSAHPGQLEDILRRLVGNPQLRQELATGSRRYVEKYWSMEAIGPKFDSLYRSLWTRKG